MDITLEDYGVEDENGFLSDLQKQAIASGTSPHRPYVHKLNNKQKRAKKKSRIAKQSRKRNR